MEGGLPEPPDLGLLVGFESGHHDDDYLGFPRHSDAKEDIDHDHELNVGDHHHLHHHHHQLFRLAPHADGEEREELAEGIANPKAPHTPKVEEEVDERTHLRNSLIKDIGEILRLEKERTQTMLASLRSSLDKEVADLTTRENTQLEAALETARQRGDSVVVLGTRTRQTEEAIRVAADDANDRYYRVLRERRHFSSSLDNWRKNLQDSLRPDMSTLAIIATNIHAVCVEHEHLKALASKFERSIKRPREEEQQGSGQSLKSDEAPSKKSSSTSSSSSGSRHC